MYFEKIDRTTWQRAEIFAHFIKDVKCVLCINADVDVTGFVMALKGRGMRFYPSFLHVVSAAVNRRAELRMGRDAQGNVGFWQCVWPSYIDFHQQDEQFTRLVTPYDADFFTFYARVTRDLARHDQVRGFALAARPTNVFDVSCLPWIHYRAFDMHVFDEGTYLAPVITWGRYAPDASGRLQLPLTLQVHHACCDGYHVARFFRDVAEEMEQCIRLLEA
nr:CatA-like O-acetyltransferase [Maliibacterium massiliense]